MNERDRREFGEFAAARSGALMGLAYVLTSDQHAAEDLLQTALTRAAARWGRIHTAPEAYVRQIMYRSRSVRGADGPAAVRQPWLTHPTGRASRIPARKRG